MPSYRLCRGDFGREHFGDPKIPDLEDFLLAVEHNVLSLEVAVQDVEGVHMFNGYHQLCKELQNVLEEEGRRGRERVGRGRWGEKGGEGGGGGGQGENEGGRGRDRERGRGGRDGQRGELGREVILR